MPMWHLQLNMGTHGQTVIEAKYPRLFQVTPAVLMMRILEWRLIGWLPTRRNGERNLKGKRRTNTWQTAASAGLDGGSEWFLRQQWGTKGPIRRSNLRRIA